MQKYIIKRILGQLWNNNLQKLANKAQRALTDSDQADCDSHGVGPEA